MHVITSGGMPDFMPVQVEIPFSASDAVANVALSECHNYLDILTYNGSGYLSRNEDIPNNLAEAIAESSANLKADNTQDTDEPKSPIGEEDEYVHMLEYAGALTRLRAQVIEGIEDDTPVATQTNFVALSETQKRVMADVVNAEQTPYAVIERMIAFMALRHSAMRPVYLRPAMVADIGTAYDAFTNMVGYYNSAGLIIPEDRTTPKAYENLPPEIQTERITFPFSHKGRMQNLRRGMVLDFFNMFGTDGETAQMADKLRMDRSSRIAKFLPYENGLAKLD